MYSFFLYVNETRYCISDNVHTTTVVVLFWTLVYDMFIYYKTWIYQCLIKQVKSPSICSRTLNSVRIHQSIRAGNRGVTLETSAGGGNTCPYTQTWPEGDEEDIPNLGALPQVRWPFSRESRGFRFTLRDLRDNVSTQA